jgi:hypothetical protein
MLEIRVRDPPFGNLYISSIANKTFPLKSIRGHSIFFSSLATGPFSGNFFLIAGSGHAGSNDTGLKILSCSRVEPVSDHANKHTDILEYE